METPPEIAALFVDLGRRAQILTELDGPQIEGWASGLFSILDESESMRAFVDHLAAQQSAEASLLCLAVAELARGLDEDLAGHAAAVAPTLGSPAQAAQFGSALLHGAWSVEAPFGRSIVLGFDVSAPPEPLESDGTSETPPEPADLRHSVLLEIDGNGRLEDIELAGPADELIAEARESPERVEIVALDPQEAIDRIVASWPHEPMGADSAGPGTAANQQFVRRRILATAGAVLPAIEFVADEVDVRRGMDDEDFAAANRAALSTLDAAVPDVAVDASSTYDGIDGVVRAWVGVIRGDGGDLSARERKALLWLEWADWLGVGIGLLRGGAGSVTTGPAFVDLVNRCPEVSSTIDKSDREYAEWAFEVAIDLLADAGAIDDGVLTEAGRDALHPAMRRAWADQA